MCQLQALAPRAPPHLFVRQRSDARELADKDAHVDEAQQRHHRAGLQVRPVLLLQLGLGLADLRIDALVLGQRALEPDGRSAWLEMTVAKALEVQEATDNARHRTGCSHKQKQHAGCSNE